MPWRCRGPREYAAETKDCRSSKRHGHKRADEDEGPEGQVTAAAGPVPGQQHPAVDGGQGERGKSAGEQCLPADPAEHGADTGGEFGVFSELKMIFMAEASVLPLTERG